jgi:hypothetical protein
MRDLIMAAMADAIDNTDEDANLLPPISPEMYEVRVKYYNDRVKIALDALDVDDLATCSTRLVMKQGSHKLLRSALSCYSAGLIRHETYLQLIEIYTLLRMYHEYTERITLPPNYIVPES